MIKKTLVITLQERDPVTREEHDILQVKRGHQDSTITLEPCIVGKMLVEKADLAQAVRDIEEFYAEKQLVQPSQEFITAQINANLKAFESEELDPTMKDTYFTVEHGE